MRTSTLKLTAHSQLFTLFFFAAVGLSTGQEIEGILQPFKDVELGASQQDIVFRAHVAEGDEVKEGQLLMDLDNRKEAVEVTRAMRILEKRRFDAESAKRLFDSSVITKEEALGKEIDLKLAEAELALAERRLAEKRIESPIDGVVVELIKHVGEPVDRAGTVLRVINLEKLYLQVLVPLPVVETLTKGMPCKVRVPGKPEPFPAKIVFINPQADSSGGLFLVKLLLENPGQRLKAGVRAAVSFGG